mgnify:FL=1
MDRGAGVNAYSSEFVQGLEALSWSLSEVLAKLEVDISSGVDAEISPVAPANPATESARSKRPAGRVPLPDPRLIRRIIRQRQSRARFFRADLFADPAWDMLLDLTAATAEHRRISVTSLCLASGVPPTTALRWIGQMEEAGLVERQEDSTDRRRAFVVLKDSAITQIARYFETIGPGAMHLV